MGCSGSKAGVSKQVSEPGPARNDEQSSTTVGKSDSAVKQVTPEVASVRAIEPVDEPTEAAHEQPTSSVEPTALVEAAVPSAQETTDAPVLSATSSEAHAVRSEDGAEVDTVANVIPTVSTDAEAVVPVDNEAVEGNSSIDNVEQTADAHSTLDDVKERIEKIEGAVVDAVKVGAEHVSHGVSEGLQVTSDWLLPRSPANSKTTASSPGPSPHSKSHNNLLHRKDNVSPHKRHQDRRQSTPTGGAHDKVANSVGTDEKGDVLMGPVSFMKAMFTPKKAPWWSAEADREREREARRTSTAAATAAAPTAAAAAATAAAATAASATAAAATAAAATAAQEKTRTMDSVPHTEPTADEVTMSDSSGHEAAIGDVEALDTVEADERMDDGTSSDNNDDEPEDGEREASDSNGGDAMDVAANNVAATDSAVSAQ